MVPRLLLLPVLLTPLLAFVAGYHMGAPETSCDTMTPRHGYSPQQTAMPYVIEVSNTTLRQGRRLMVTVRRDQQYPAFKGFFVQARRAQDLDGGPVGKFYTKKHATVPCGGSPSSSITHSEGKPKQSVTLLWESPAQLDEDVLFRVSVVQNYKMFWVNQDSARVRVSRSGRELPLPDTTAAGPRPPAATAPPPSPTPAEEHDMTELLVGSRRKRPDQRTTATPCVENCDPTVSTTASAALAGRTGVAGVYDDCLLSKGCFSLSDNCIQGRNCDLMVTYRRLRSGAFRLQLFGRYNPGSFLAVGFSRDKAMGEDAVVYCTSRSDGRFQILHAYNFGRQSSIPLRAFSKEGPLVSDFSSEFRDGLLICEFTHSPRFRVRDEDFDLASDPLHLLVASGTTSADEERRPQYHSASRRATAGLVALASSAAGGGPVFGDAPDSGALFRAHGALMVIGWLGAASVGMLVARYYKDTWPGRRLAGLDVWFQAHRSLMVLTVLCSVAGLVCILLQLEGWTTTDVYTNPHPLLGIICIVLAVLQPVMAVFRCSPTAARRPIFNWLHWLVGSAAHLLGIASIFFAVTLPAAQLPFWTYWLLAAFVAFHVVCHLVMSTQQCAADRAARQKGSSEAYSMRDIGTNGYSSGQAAHQGEAAGAGLRRAVLAIYTLVALTVSTLLVVMVVLAPADKWGDR